jgi:hypothetical protein
MLGRPGQASFKPGVGKGARVNGPATLYFDSGQHALYLLDRNEFVFGKIK